MKRTQNLLAILVLLLSQTGPIGSVDAQTDAMDILVAGVPRYIGETATDAELFGHLGEAGIGQFLPFFQYQEVPASLSLDRQNDFFPPCTEGEEPFASMRANGVGLVIPGQLLWPRGQDPAIGDEYLRQFIECAGADGIAAVFSVDEPAFYVDDIDLREGDVRLIYERSKAQLPDVPVVMVHGPIVNERLENDAWRPITEDEVLKYLEDVGRLSAWADVVGFDLYMIPSETAKISAPGYGIDVLDYTVAFPAYIDWLHDNVPGRRTMLVLQAFGYADLVVLEPDASSRRPEPDEITGMACTAWASGADSIGWWGQTHLAEDGEPLWEAVLEISAGLSTDPEQACPTFARSF